MMTQQTIEKLRALRLRGMAEAYQQQLENAAVAGLTFDERLAMLVDCHATWREDKALARRLKTSRLNAEPCAEDVNYRHARQLDGAQFRSLLLQSQWVAQHQSVLLTGPTGPGAGTQSLPRRLSSVVSPGGEAVSRFAAGSGRRQLEPSLTHAHQGGRAGGG